MNASKSLAFLTRSLIFISVTFMLLTASSAFIYASFAAGKLIWELVMHNWFIPKVEFHFIEVIERFLTAIAILFLGIGLFELFIQPLSLPTTIKVKSFHELKSNLGNIILLNMVVIFFGDLVEEKEPQILILESVAIGIISGVLLVFSQFQHTHSPSVDIPDRDR
jgi:uncharacterized membrane protein YqhA